MEENPKKSSNKKRKKMMKKSDEEADRLSALPEPLLHNILSFLDMKEVVQTSFISKKWRYFWKSLPFLNFDYSLWNASSKKKKQHPSPYVQKVFTKQKCLNFVDGVLLFRDNSSPIEKIHITQSYACDSLRLSKWLLFVASRHVKEVQIDFDKSCKVVTLPDLLFTSHVEVLKLTGNHWISVQLPGLSSPAKKLRSLILVYVKLPNGNSNGELDFNYPLLENLVLILCDLQHIKKLKVTTPQLKNLVVECGYNGEINISAPKLLSVKLNAHQFKIHYVEKLSSLVSATIDITAFTLQSESMLQVLEGLQTVTTLQINGHYKELLLLNPFSNLRCFKLMGMCRSSCIQALGNFLKSSPSLETLVLDECSRLI
ncbi:hypothetical protein AQUCO_05000026v1 [Aquilegia coerulea]|uniref:F-box domain-containing protein n=1 Tax=Aquilegia coerulea TaxID=218851 RepID=A0A2G5CKJ1_AQUCA|nr:hypothetical protein AQUCO_05000026v1 [Aquilegia coerulea]